MAGVGLGDGAAGGGGHRVEVRSGVRRQMMLPLVQTRGHSKGEEPLVICRALQGCRSVRPRRPMDRCKACDAAALSHTPSPPWPHAPTCSLK